MGKKRVLLVDDDETVLILIKEQVKKLGYSVSAAVTSGEAAVQEVENNRPDLVLMDIKLGTGMDGVEAAEEIRARFNVPVVFLTACSDQEILDRAKITEPYGYLVKPVKERELHSNIEMALYKHHMELELKKHRYHLEQLVEERTTELIEANGLLRQEINEQKRLRKEFHQKLEKMKEEMDEIIQSLAVHPE